MLDLLFLTSSWFHLISENWRRNSRRSSATWVARCFRAMLQRRPLCRMRGLRVVTQVMRSWHDGSNPQGCSIWLLHWPRRGSTIASFPISSCRVMEHNLPRKSRSFLNCLGT